MGARLSFRSTVLTVLLFAVAMAYLESAVVVYLTLALGGQVGALFPLRPVIEAGDLIAIEVGREAATLVMIAAVGVLVGRSKVERLAWSAVVFGAWDIGYYAWLFVFSGWPPALGTRAPVPATCSSQYPLPCRRQCLLSSPSEFLCRAGSGRQGAWPTRSPESSRIHRW